MAPPRLKLPPPSKCTIFGNFVKYFAQFLKIAFILIDYLITRKSVVNNSKQFYLKYSLPEGHH